MLSAPSLNRHEQHAAEPTLELSEVFSSVQGEGPSAGTPALFVRLAICNLRCDWCDTKYTWDFKTYRYSEEVRSVPLEEVRERILRAPERRVIVTGGEPLLQQRELAMLFARIPPEITIEVETNGTVLIDSRLAARVNQWNVSPKLAHSGEPRRRRVQPGVLRALRDTGRANLKLVIRGAVDLEEVEALIAELGWPRSAVYLMPQASTTLEYRERAEVVKALCAAHDFGFSPRLHVLEFGGVRGR